MRLEKGYDVGQLPYGHLAGKVRHARLAAAGDLVFGVGPYPVRRIDHFRYQECVC